MKRQQPTPHPFADSGYTDGALKPQRICGTCGLPEKNLRHTLPATTDEARAFDAARLGETKEHQPT